jgi:hypothetical protein
MASVANKRVRRLQTLFLPEFGKEKSLTGLGELEGRGRPQKSTWWIREGLASRSGADVEKLLFPKEDQK